MIIQPPNTNLLINADCLTAMKELPDNSVDSIVTDPPYGLSFMGKKWDYDVPSIEVWKECLRVLKHGGMLLSFAGSRTYHRMAVNIEDAGFEIRDQIMWIYGSGFPKSHNIGKAIDKLQGNERENLGKNPNARKTSGNIQICKKDGSGVLTKGTSDWEGWGTALKPAHEPIVVARKPLSEKTVALNVLKYGTGGINIDACRIEAKDNMGDWDRFKGYQNKNTIRKNMVDKKEDDFKERCDNGINNQGRFPANIILDEEAGKILDEQSGKSVSKTLNGSSFKVEDNGDYTSNVYGKYKAQNTIRGHNDKDGASRFFDWEGWGTALKPACEPIVVARKPLSEKNVALNVLKWGTGGINIDDCRIETDENLNGGAYSKGEYSTKEKVYELGLKRQEGNYQQPQGRFPANIILDEEAGEILDEQSGKSVSKTLNGSSFKVEDNGDYTSNVYGKYKAQNTIRGHNDKDGASRFFYCAKASKSDRNEGCEELEDKRGGSMDANVSDKMQLGGASLKGEHKEIQPTKNNHPTVKPTKLMQYLVRLVTPKGAVCLDPFMGSGSTGKACVLEGMDFIGIELDESYFEIAKKRINAVKVNTLDNYTESNGVTK